MIRRFAHLLAPACICALLAACGGGGGGSSFSSTGGSGNTTPPPPPGLSITTTAIPTGRTGAAYSTTLQASGGTAPYKWSLSNAPTWLTIDADLGKLSGNIPASYPVWAGPFYYISITLTDSASPAHTVQKTFELMTYGAVTVTDQPINGTRNVSYSWTPNIAGGRSPYTVTVDSGMPPGLQLGVDAQQRPTFTGTPTQAGTFTAQLHVKDSDTPPQDVVIPLTFTFDSKLTITSARLKAGVVGRPYSDQLIAVNGTAPLTWSVTYLAAGLTLDAATGAISGTPTSSYFGSGIFVSVKDSSSPQLTASKFIIFPIYQALAFQPVSPFATHIQTYFSQSMVLGGLPPVTVTVDSGSVPPGMNIESNGYFSGSPTATGTYSFTLTATDSDNPPVSIQSAFTFTVLPPLPVLADLELPTGAFGKAYSAKLWARDGTVPYTWSIASGQLPPGLSLSADGNISGTPTAISGFGPGFTFTAAATDSASPPQTGTHPYWIPVFAAAKGRNDSIATATPAGPGGLQASLSPFADPPGSTTSAPDTDYYKMIGKGGGSVTINIASTTTVDPVIEILDANGQRYKTCKDPGDDNPTLTFIVKDTTPDAFDDECLNDDIDPTVNRSAQLQFQVPGAAGSLTTFYVHVFDSSGNARPDMTYSMDTSGDAIWPMYLSQIPLPIGKVGTAFTGTVNVVNAGTATITYQLVGGTLPPGLSFTSNSTAGTASVTGTPTTAGTYTFTVQATNSDTPPQVATQIYGITVNP